MDLIDLIGTAGPAAHLVRRPSGVAHVTTGPLTPSGRFVAVPRRTVCRVHNRRLTVLPERYASLTTASPVPVRLCTPCVARLSRDPERRAMSGLQRDELAAAFAGVSVAELATALFYATTSDETHRIGRVALIVFGPPPVRTAENRRRLTRQQHDLVDLNDAINKVRSRFRTAELSDEERAAIVAARERDAEVAVAAIKARKREIWKDREDRINRIGITNADRYR